MTLELQRPALDLGMFVGDLSAVERSLLDAKFAKLAMIPITADQAQALHLSKYGFDIALYSSPTSNALIKVMQAPADVAALKTVDAVGFAKNHTSYRSR